MRALPLYVSEDVVFTYAHQKRMGKSDFAKEMVTKEISSSESEKSAIIFGNLDAQYSKVKLWTMCLTLLSNLGIL